MNIQQITSREQFDQIVDRFQPTLAIWNFGPLADVDADTLGDALVFVAFDSDAPIAYLIAEPMFSGSALHHIEVLPAYRRQGIALELARRANIRYAYEVCTDASAALCRAIGIEFEDTRDIWC